jgi:hypothetical protein
MADEKRGLPRPKAPVDLFTLQPEPDLVTETVADAPAAAERTRPSAARPRAPRQQRPPKRIPARPAVVPRAARIKTSVELLPETLELIDQVKAQYRREFRRHLPVWKLLDDAVRELARSRLKNTDFGKSVD